jgi:hypothetical protein
MTESDDRLVVTVDFDGIIVKQAFPEVGETNHFVVQCLKKIQGNGAYLILNTCRWGDHLDAALDRCSSLGLEFDAVNENLDHMIRKWGECRKLGGHLYIDDRDICHSPARLKLRLWMLANFYRTMCKRYNGR